MFLFKLLTIVIIIIAILLIGVILLQEPKERIVASGGGGIAVHRIGINQKADFLEKATWILASLLLGLALLSAVSLKYSVRSVVPVNAANLQEMEASHAESSLDADCSSVPKDQAGLEPDADQ